MDQKQILLNNKTVHTTIFYIWWNVTLVTVFHFFVDDDMFRM
jgi:hypothetical protein